MSLGDLTPGGFKAQIKNQNQWLGGSPARRRSPIIGGLKKETGQVMAVAAIARTNDHIPRTQFAES
jgi:hypothetical protein